MGFQGRSVVGVAALKDHGNCGQGTSGLAKEIRSCNDGHMEMSWEWTAIVLPAGLSQAFDWASSFTQSSCYIPEGKISGRCKTCVNLHSQ